MRYVDLMERKPHLLISVKNNLGGETHVRYAPFHEVLSAGQAGGEAELAEVRPSA
jgi:hypothetical protein